jgi:hypothetical protein
MNFDNDFEPISAHAQAVFLRLALATMTFDGVRENGTTEALFDPAPEAAYRPLLVPVLSKGQGRPDGGE